MNPAVEKVPLTLRFCAHSGDFAPSHAEDVTGGLSTGSCILCREVAANTMCLGKPNKLNEEFPPWQFCWWSFFGWWKGDPFQKLLRDLRVRDRKVTSSESPGLYCNRKLRGVAKTLIAVGEWSIDLFLVKGNRFWPSQIQCFGRTQYRTVCWVFLYIYIHCWDVFAWWEVYPETMGWFNHQAIQKLSTHLNLTVLKVPSMWAPLGLLSLLLTSLGSMNLWIIETTLPETNIAPENRPSQKETSIPTIHFQVLC